MRGWLVPVVVGALCACEDPCGLPDCDPSVRPVQGAPADFVAGPSDDPPVRVSAAAACTPPVAGHGILVEREGTAVLTHAPSAPTDVDGLTWLLEVAKRLEAEGAASHVRGFGTACLPGANARYYVGTDDWRETDAIVRGLVAALEADDLDGAVEVRIVEQSVACPDVACGY